MQTSHFPVFLEIGMGEKERLQLNKVITCFVVLSLVCLCLYGLFGIYGFSLFPDEFGYWAPAARLLGYDWSEVTSIGSYYSFGYSVILTPILLLVGDSIATYRTAIIINLLFQIISFFIIRRILAHLISANSEIWISLLSGIAVLYPSWIFYTQMTMSEGVIFLFYHLVILLMFEYLDKPNVVNGVMLVLCTLYLYSVHMRTVGVMALVFVTFIITSLQRENNRILSVSLCILTIIGFVICIYIKGDVINALYSSCDVSRVATNDYSGQTGKLLSIFTFEGIGNLLCSMAGKILYLGCASFGTAYIGIYSLGKRAVKKDLKSAFVLLISLAEFMVMNIYLMGTAHPGNERFDLFIHGRYYDFAIPSLMILGIEELLNSKKYIKKIIVADLILILSGAFSLLIMSRNEVAELDPHGMLMIGMSYFLDEEQVNPTIVIMGSALLALVLGIVVTLLLLIVRKKHNYVVFLAVLLIQMGLGYHAMNHFIYLGQSYIYGDIQVADKITDLRISGNNGDIVLLYEDNLECIDNVQFRLPDEKIKVVYMSSISDSGKYINSLPDNVLVLVDFESKLNEMVDDRYNKSWESGHFILHYNDSKKYCEGR